MRRIRPEGRAEARPVQHRIGAAAGGSAVGAAFVSWLVAVAAASGCVPPPRPRTTLEARDLRGPEGSTLEVACTPSGVELCFDALDNNCNGVIDEGCGLHTGILQFTIAWGEREADVDLNVTDPEGDLAKPGGTTGAGLVKDRDCPGAADECHGQNVENVFLDESEPQRGRYRAVVRLEKLNGAVAPIRVRLSARIGARTMQSRFELAAPGDERVLEFSL